MIRRLSVAAFGAVFLLAASAPTVNAQPLGKDPAACQSAVAKGLFGFKKGKLKAWAKCLDSILKGKPCDTVKRDAAITKAIGKANAAIAGKCTDALLFNAPPNGVGFAMNCQLEVPPLEPYETGCYNLPVTNGAQFTACRICWKEGELYEFLKILYPCLAGTVPNGSDLDCGVAPGSCPDPVAGKAEVACLTTISKNAIKYFLTREKGLEKCLNSVMSGKLTGNCPDAALAAKLPLSSQKAKDAIAKKCTALPGWWSVCPEGEPCGGAISTVSGISSCVIDNASVDIVNELLCQQFPQHPGITCPPSEGTTTTSTNTTATSASTTTTTCNCCPTGVSLLSFTTGTPAIGGGGCGDVRDSGNNVLFNLDCGGLYTGGGANTVSLPTVVPDLGKTYTKTSGCVGTSFNIAPTAPGDHSGLVTIRSCSTGGIADSTYPACDGGTRVGQPCVVNSDCPPSSTCGGGGASMTGCLFGPPLPIPNTTFTGASVCVINRVQTSASGSGNCSQGTTSLSLPLLSDLYLEGDLLDGSAGDRPNVAGIQPCPLCNTSTGLCQGGPRHGLGCSPGDSASLGAAYPTSHDCPPPPGALGSAYVGALQIGFNLTTDPSGTAPAEHKVATLMNGQEVFCGFCGNVATPTFKNPAVPCTSNANCTGITGCPGTVACGTCKQHTSGAFATVPGATGAEHEITLKGAPAGVCISDGVAHNSTLVSAFCIPPAFNATVDNNGDLPGPGATALIGQAQIIP